MTYNPPITEDDLHGYIDHALDPTRRAAVQDYLDAHPDVAARITAYERQRNSLRSALRPIAEEPIPPQLNLRHIAEQRRRAWGLPWRSMAAAVLLLASGGAGGWSLPGHRRIAVGCPRHRRLGARGSVYVRHLRFRSRPSGGIWGGRQGTACQLDFRAIGTDHLNSGPRCLGLSLHGRAPGCDAQRTGRDADV